MNIHWSTITPAHALRIPTNVRVSCNALSLLTWFTSLRYLLTLPNTGIIAFQEITMLPCGIQLPPTSSMHLYYSSLCMTFSKHVLYLPYRFWECSQGWSSLDPCCQLACILVYGYNTLILWSRCLQVFWLMQVWQPSISKQCTKSFQYCNVLLPTQQKAHTVPHI